jgi:hypothetical protein
LKEDFEALFGNGGDDATKLEFPSLGDYADIDKLLMATLLQPDDKLFAKGLDLYQRTYQQRKGLIKAVQEVILLPSPKLAVYIQDIHNLRVELNDLSYFLSNYSVWGVKSRLSGPFDDHAFNATMQFIRRLMQFL